MNFIYTLIQNRIQRRRRHNNSQFELEQQRSFTEPTIQETSLTTTTTTRHHPQEVQDEEHCPPPPQEVSFLYSLATRWAWNAVLYRCETHPEEVDVKYRDNSGDTVLHWACFGVAPINVVQVLLDICPDLAKIPNHLGHLPLHVACSYRASSDVITALLHVYPQGAGIPNGAGSYSLHIVCDYGCKVQSIQAILQTIEGAQTVTVQDNMYRRTPLYILHERTNLTRYRRSLDEIISIRQRQREIQLGSMTRTRRRSRRREEEEDEEVDVNNNDNSIVLISDDQIEIDRLEASIDEFQTETIKEYWEKAQRLVLSEYLRRPLVQNDIELLGCGGNGNGCGGILHACIGIENCPPSLLELAILLRADQLLQVDKEGRVPLHLACAVSTPAVVMEVLLACPRSACITDGNDNLPLSIFVERLHRRSNPSLVLRGGAGGVGGVGWSGPIQELIVTNPIAIEALGLDTRLYPRIWSRLTTNTTTSSTSSSFPTTTRIRHIQALYESIRGNPGIFGCSSSTTIKRG